LSLPTSLRALALALALVLPAPAAISQAPAADAPQSKDDAAAPLVIADGRQVSLEYTLTTDDGAIADTNVGGAPLTYQQGAEQILPALEQALAGMAVGQEKKVHLTADQAYGPRDPSLADEVPAHVIPEDARQVGAELVAQGEDGSQRLVRVKEVREDVVVIDLNHPLAGESLHFAVKILAIE